MSLLSYIFCFAEKASRRNDHTYKRNRDEDLQPAKKQEGDGEEDESEVDEEDDEEG